MNEAFRLIKKGIQNPTEVLPYILGKIFPNSRYGGNVEKRDGYITFTEGGFAASPSSRPEFSAKLYYEASELQNIIDEYSNTSKIDKTLEIGCGYGRLSPFISELAEEAFSIEPNQDALRDAKKHYPHIQFRGENAEEISFDDYYFDVVVTWTVLQHIPPDSIANVCGEIQRVTKDQGIVVIAESTGDSNGPTLWGRSKKEYEDLLQMGLRTSKPKPVERTFNESNTAEGHSDDTLMVFINN